MGTQSVAERPVAGTASDRETIADRLRRDAGLLALAFAGFALLFWPTASRLVEYWWREPDFSHGFLVPIISGVILYADRERLGAVRAERSLLGLAVLLGSLLLFFAGTVTSTNSFERLGLIGSLVGAVWFYLGSPLLRTNLFPFFYLLFCVPPPFYHLASFRSGLRGVVTEISARVLSRCGEHAFANGNILVVGSEQFGVTDACSGVRSLLAITATAVLLAYIWKTGIARGALLALTAVPITVAANVARLLAIAIASRRLGVDLTEGWPHEVLGLVCFALSLAGLYASWRFYDWFFRWRTRS